ncbi:sugar ABC transporter permease [Paenibacillus sp. BC26]|uniref:ABC transporter permease n=1 Tax=Paenibacillus sp. BC26 TaxID=1881032 RepID=UPI0008E925EC|nr:ABC transporter permease subunit [Paenibacillus sp. BC26]SFS51600.1 putative aldouronate transport system permease protein [Paenibacillus sp. BC26]
MSGRGATAWSSRRRALRHEWRRNKLLFLLLLPGTLYLFINNYLPMFGIVIAFKQVNFTKGIWNSPWNGFKNFDYLFSSTDTFLITRNTVLYNLLFIVLGTVIAIAFAALLGELRRRFLVTLFQSMMFFPYVLSFVVVSYLGFAFLSIEHGFINNHLLKPLGFDAIEWYNDPRYWPYILTLVYLWKNLGYSTIIYMAAIIGIETSYYEAAVMEGASKWQQFTSITLPLLKPVIIILTVLGIGKIFFADFGLFYLVPLASGPLYPTTLVIDTQVYNVLRLHNDIGMAAAVGLYQAAIGFLLVLLSNTIIRKVSKENALF